MNDRDSKGLTLAELLALEREIRDKLEGVRVAIALETGSDPVLVADPTPRARRASHLHLVDPLPRRPE